MVRLGRLTLPKTGVENWQLISAALLSGLCGVGVVAFAHTGVHSMTGEPDGSAFLPFLFTGILYVLSLQQFASRFGTVIQRALGSLRSHDEPSLSTTQHRDFERQAVIVSRSAAAIALALHVATLLLLSLLYMFVFSRLAVLGATLIYGACALLYVLGRRHAQQLQQQARGDLDVLTDTLAKTLAEVKATRPQGRLTPQQTDRVQELLESLRTHAGERTQRARHAALVTQLVPCVLLGFLVFALPRLEPIHDEALHLLTALSILLIGLVDVFVAGVFALERADRAAERLAASVERSAA